MPPGAQDSSLPKRSLADGLGPDPVLVDKDAQGAAVDLQRAFPEGIAKHRPAGDCLGAPHPQKRTSGHPLACHGA